MRGGKGSFFTSSTMSHIVRENVEDEAKRGVRASVQGGYVVRPKEGGAQMKGRGGEG